MSDTLSQLVPRSGERAFVVGQTGCGKSYFLKAMVAAYIGLRQVIIIDSKHDPIWEGLGAKYVYNLAQMERVKWPKHKVVVWRPSGEEAQDYASYDAFFAWLFARGNTVCVVDEVAQVMPGPTGYGSGFADVVTRGRVRGLTVFYATQRPAGVPRVVYSESNRFFVFFVSDRRDRETIAAFTSPALAGEVPDRHGFFYYSTKSREAVYYSKLAG